MILPSNGKVVIFDDKYVEVQNLIAGLSSKKVSFVYYQDENMGDLPETPIENVRLVFLDLLLISDIEPPVRQVISTIIGRLKKVISKRNGPYILFYWSTKKSKYRNALERELNKKKLSPYKPFLILSLPKPSTFEQIQMKLSTEFEKAKSLKAFLFLESLANNAIGNSVNDLLSVYPKEDNWDKRLKGVLYKCSNAVVGKENMKDLNDADKFKYSMWAMNTMFADEIEKRIRRINESIVGEISDYDTSLLVRAKLNSKLSLLCEEESELEPSTGNIYFRKKNNTLIKQILSGCLEKNQTIETVMETDPIIVGVDVTPICDYSQYKNYLRFLPGLLLSEKAVKLIKTSENFYRSQSFFIKDEIRNFLFDFRFASSITKEQLVQKGYKSKLKFRNEVVLEIQSKFAKYVNRPGIIIL